MDPNPILIQILHPNNPIRSCYCHLDSSPKNHACRLPSYILVVSSQSELPRCRLHPSLNFKLTSALTVLPFPCRLTSSYPIPQLILLPNQLVLSRIWLWPTVLINGSLFLCCCLWLMKKSRELLWQNHIHRNQSTNQ